MIQTFKNRVIILPNERTETVTESGLVLQKSYNPELGLRRGKVVAIGELCREVKVGDEACYMAHVGRGFEIDGVRYLTMMEEEICGITTED